MPTSSGNLAVGSCVQAQSHHTSSPRAGQWQNEMPVLPFPPIIRGVAIGPSHRQRDRSYVWAVLDQPVFSSPQRKASDLVCLDSGSLAYGHECIFSSVSVERELCFSSFSARGTMSSSSLGPLTVSSGPSVTCVASTAVASSPALTTNRLPSANQHPQLFRGPSRQPTSAGGSTAPHCMAYFQSALQSKAFLSRLQACDAEPGGHQHPRGMTVHARNGVAGMLNRVSIPSHRRSLQL